MKIIVTDQAGETHELEGLDGWRAMEVIRDWGLNIKAECGGACTCATCHVWVDPQWQGKLPAASADEEDLIYSTLDLGVNLLLLSSLSYLGLGAQPPNAELGTIIAGGQHVCGNCRCAAFQLQSFINSGGHCAVDFDLTQVV